MKCYIWVSKNVWIRYDTKLLLFDRSENWVIIENLSKSDSSYFSYHLFLYISIQELSLLT